MHSDFELKVLSLIGSMKNEIDILKEEVALLKNQLQHTQPDLASEVDKLSINDVRDYIKSQLFKLNPQLQFTNGSRSLGKLTISNGENTIDRILIRTSKSFREKEGYASGWFTFNESLLNKYDIYFFVVKDFDKELHVLVLNKTEIQEWIRHKTTDSNGNYHFYVNHIHGKWIDDREGVYDCSRFYNNWGVVEQLLISKECD
ncbi:hypothetical protein [Paenibacillus sp. RUD330]|uniref:hypothetical protein n=1 Tax=Paenibacillus sp. RUD330 TaxID=2023772 RepID=UPI0012FD463A|nr:hypothetical protein [Paenibacillus sp. RUD330]QID16107.1 hypothetical protein CIC07_25630 [Paenibacillus sp. RUD330]